MSYEKKQTYAIAFKKTQKDTIAYLKAMNMSNSEIAYETGINPSIVKALTLSKSFMSEVEAVKEKINKNPQKLFDRILPKAIKVVHSVLTDKKAKDSDKLNAAQMIMDRALGKPKQQVEHTSSLLADMIEKMENNRKEKKDYEIVEVDPIDQQIESNIQ